MGEKEMRAEESSLLSTSTVHLLEEEENNPIVPKTPEKKHRFKHIPNVETPFKIQKSRKEIYKKASVALAPFLDSEEMKEEAEWFKKKRAGRKKKSIFSTYSRASSIIASAEKICSVYDFFLSHFITKKILHASDKSIVYTVEKRRVTDSLQVNNAYICAECADKDLDSFSENSRSEAEKRVVKVARTKWHTIKERLHRIREAKFLYKLRWSRNIVQIVRAWEEGYIMYIEMSLCNSGTLREYLKKKENIPMKEKANLIMQMLYGLRDIHGAKIVHLDLKPENIYLHREEKNLVVRIGDFGISRKAADSTEIEFDGDRLYLAPELLQNSCSFSSDVYSMGLIILEILFEVKMPLKNVLWAKVSIENKRLIVEKSGISQKVYNTIKAMIHKNSKKRPTAETLVKEMEKSFSTYLSVHSRISKESVALCK